MEKPASCPLYVNVNQLVDFGTGARFDGYATFGHVVFSNDDVQIVAQGAIGYTAHAGDPHDSSDDWTEAYATASYPAATAGWMTGTDVASLIFYTIDHGSPSADVSLDYQRYARAQIAGPGSVLPHQDFTLTSNFYDAMFVGPLSYRWVRNGVILPATGTTITEYSGEMGTQFNYELTITDATGQSAIVSHYLYTKLCDFEGCYDQ